MPIVEIPNSNDPLGQGDILKGVTLYASGWSEGRCDAKQTEAEACMIVSRPCVALAKKHVIAASVEKYQLDVPKDLKGIEAIVDFLKAAQLGSGRYRVRLDMLHAISLPSRPKLAELLPSHRIARLHPDYARHLHVRLFDAFASMGFEDTGWLSEEDLQWIVSVGQTTVSELQAGIAKASAAGSGHEKEKATLLKRQEELKPYLEELSKRGKR